MSQTDTVIFTRPSFVLSAALLPSAILPLPAAISLPRLHPAAPAATTASKKRTDVILLIFIIILPQNYKSGFLTTRFSYSFGVYPVIFLKTALK